MSVHLNIDGCISAGKLSCTKLLLHCEGFQMEREIITERNDKHMEGKLLNFALQLNYKTRPGQ